MELQIPFREVQQASLQVRWCINGKEQETITSLPQDEEAFVLLLGVHVESREEVRHLARVGDVFQYLTFSRPGTWRLFAGVVSACRQKGSPYKSALGVLKDVFLVQSRHATSGYAEQLFSLEGTDPSLLGDHFRSRCVILTEAWLEVAVPAELFAKEPPAWERHWVTKILRSPVRDQCDYRKRRMFAYTAQPMLYLLLAAVAFSVGLTFRLGAVAILSLFGFWSLRWKYVPNIFSMPLRIWEHRVGTDENVYLQSLRAQARRRDAAKFRLYPEKMGARKTEAARREAEAARRETEAARREAEKLERVRLQRLAETQLLLACDTPLSEIHLPTRKRVRLFVTDIKNKVCLPLAR